MRLSVFTELFAVKAFLLEWQQEIHREKYHRCRPKYSGLSF